MINDGEIKPKGLSHMPKDLISALLSLIESRVGKYKIDWDELLDRSTLPYDPTKARPPWPHGRAKNEGPWCILHTINNIIGAPIFATPRDYIKRQVYKSKKSAEYEMLRIYLDDGINISTFGQIIYLMTENSKYEVYEIRRQFLIPNFTRNMLKNGSATPFFDELNRANTDKIMVSYNITTEGDDYGKMHTVALKKKNDMAYTVYDSNEEETWPLTTRTIKNWLSGIQNIQVLVLEAAYLTNDPNAKLVTHTNRSEFSLSKLSSINTLRKAIGHKKLPKLADGTQSSITDSPAMKSSHDNQRLANGTNDEIPWGIGASANN
jgi:hypothetical protein